jgi:hypothetical protein
VNLYLESADPPHTYTFILPDGSLGTLPGIRLIGFADLRRHITNPPHLPYAIQKCLVDTGSFLSIVPHRIAQYLDLRTVTWLPFHPSVPIGMRTLVIAGLSIPYELGEISVRLRDKDGNELNVQLLAKFTQDGGRLPIPLTLGLRGGFLEGRTLHAEPDAAAPFGQGWTLAEP